MWLIYLKVGLTNKDNRG